MDPKDPLRQFTLLPLNLPAEEGQAFLPWGAPPAAPAAHCPRYRSKDTRRRERQTQTSQAAGILPRQEAADRAHAGHWENTTHDFRTGAPTHPSSTRKTQAIFSQFVSWLNADHFYFQQAGFIPVLVAAPKGNALLEPVFWEMKLMSQNQFIMKYSSSQEIKLRSFYPWVTETQ